MTIHFAITPIFSCLYLRSCFSEGISAFENSLLHTFEENQKAKSNTLKLVD